MKTMYEQPELEIIEFHIEDVITESTGEDETDQIPANPNS